MTVNSNSTVWYEWIRGETCGTTVRFTVDDNIVWDYWISDQAMVVCPETVGGTVRDKIISKVFKNAFEYKPAVSTRITAEQKRAKEMQHRIRHEWRKLLAEEEKQEKDKAELVAQELLLDLIGEDELKRYKETGRLFVKGNKFDYVLRKGGGVHRIHKDKVVDFVKKKEASGKTICVHPKRCSEYPPTDNVITLKMWIENNEKEFLEIGNLGRSLSVVPDFNRVVGL